MSLSGAVAAEGNQSCWQVVPMRAFLSQRKVTGKVDLPLLGVSLATGVRVRAENDGRPAPSDDLASYKVVRRGDVVMNRLGKPHGSVGVSPYSGITSPAYWVMSVNRDVADPIFIHHLLRSRHLIAEYGRLGKFMPPNQFDISWESFRDIRVPLPSLEEQRRIANLLDGEIVRLDQTIYYRVRQQQNLAELAAATVSEILIPGILTKPAGVGKFPWLPECSTAAKMVKLGLLCRLQSGLTVDVKRDIEGDVVTRPYLRVANVQAGQVILDEVAEITVPRSIARRCALRKGDVLMTEGGDLDKLGRGAVWNGELPDCLHQNHIFALRVNPERLDGSYLAYMTQTVHGRCYFESTGVKTTNLASTNSSKILGFPVPLPGIDIQRELVREVQAALGAIDRMQVALSRQLAGVAERRQALITAAVTGQIDVTMVAGVGV